jgi:hypothetical protein
MLGSQAASWVGLGVAGLPAVVPVAVFYWLWALKNRLLGPLRSDLGVATFGLVLASEYTPGRNRYGALQGVHLNPLGLFLCTFTPYIWSMLGACRPF